MLIVPALTYYTLPSTQPLTNVQRGPTTVLSSASMMEGPFTAAAILDSSWVKMEPAVQVSHKCEGKGERREGNTKNKWRNRI